MSSTQQGDFRVRAYMLQNTLEYLTESPSMSALVAHIPDTTFQLAKELAPAAWCPGEKYTEVLKILAKSANGDDERAKELLIASGTYVARTATNTFLRLLMKMLTPGLFAKKLPDFWKRDCSIGRLEVEVAPPKITCRFVDMTVFEHAACTGAGFLSSAFQGMGKTIVKVELKDWSLSKPSSDCSVVELTWAE